MAEFFKKVWSGDHKIVETLIIIDRFHLTKLIS